MNEINKMAELFHLENRLFFLLFAFMQHFIFRQILSVISLWIYIYIYMYIYMFEKRFEIFKHDVVVEFMVVSFFIPRRGGIDAFIWKFFPRTCLRICFKLDQCNRDSWISPRVIYRHTRVQCVQKKFLWVFEYFHGYIVQRWEDWKIFHLNVI